jgi:hypothetical protein
MRARPRDCDPKKRSGECAIGGGGHPTPAVCVRVASSMTSWILDASRAHLVYGCPGSLDCTQRRMYVGGLTLYFAVPFSSSMPVPLSCSRKEVQGKQYSLVEMGLRPSTLLVFVFRHWIPVFSSPGRVLRTYCSCSRARWSWSALRGFPFLSAWSCCILMLEREHQL